MARKLGSLYPTTQTPDSYFLWLLWHKNVSSNVERSFDSAQTMVLIAKASGVWPVGFTDAGSVPRQPLNTHIYAWPSVTHSLRQITDKNKLLYKNISWSYIYYECPYLVFGWLGVKEKSIQMDLDYERNGNITKKCRWGYLQERFALLSHSAFFSSASPV